MFMYIYANTNTHTHLEVRAAAASDQECVTSKAGLTAVEHIRHAPIRVTGRGPNLQRVLADRDLYPFK